jgi:hypothetical protein
VKNVLKKKILVRLQRFNICLVFSPGPSTHGEVHIGFERQRISDPHIKLSGKSHLESKNANLVNNGRRSEGIAIIIGIKHLQETILSVGEQVLKMPTLKSK